jgi:hypothetical protein
LVRDVVRVPTTVTAAFNVNVKLMILATSHDASRLILVISSGGTYIRRDRERGLPQKKQRFQR